MKLSCPRIRLFRPRTRWCCGAVCLYSGHRPDTLNIDEKLIEAAITPRTKAIFPIIIWSSSGNGSDHESAELHGLFVVEDAAKPSARNTRGAALDRSATSQRLVFMRRRILSRGAAGTPAINDPTLIERAEIIREKGTNRKRFFRLSHKYTPGQISRSSFLPGELVAAFLFGQFEQIHAIQTINRELESI